MFALLALWPKAMYRLRGGIFRLLIIAAGGKCGHGLRVERGLRVRQRLHKGWKLGCDIYLGRNTTIDCLPGSTFVIGSNTTLTEGAFISVCQRVDIGMNSLIGEYCSIRDANHEISDVERPIVDQPMAPLPIVVGQNVWLGRGVAVLAGSLIGSGAVVGANSVVNREILPNSVNGGVPSKLIRMRIES